MSTMTCRCGTRRPAAHRRSIASVRRPRRSCLGAVVGLNGGTTATEVARALATRPDPVARPTPAVTVVTNALNIAWELAVRRQIKIVVTGGAARPQSYELIGPLAGRILEDISLDIVLLGVDQVDPVDGAMAHHEGEAAVNTCSRRMPSGWWWWLTRPSSGVGRSRASVGRRRSTTLVTDTDADPDLVAHFRAAGIEVLWCVTGPRRPLPT